MSNNNRDSSNPVMESALLSIRSVKTGETKSGTWARFTGFQMYQKKSEEKRGEYYGEAVSVDGFFSTAMWEKLKPWHKLLLAESDDYKARIRIVTHKPIMNAPTAYVRTNDGFGKNNAEPVLHLVVHRISQVKVATDGAEWTKFEDEKKRLAIEKAGRAAIRNALIEAGLIVESNDSGSGQPVTSDKAGSVEAMMASMTSGAPALANGAAAAFEDDIPF